MFYLIISHALVCWNVGSHPSPQNSMYEQKIPFYFCKPRNLVTIVHNCESNWAKEKNNDLLTWEHQEKNSLHLVPLSSSELWFLCFVLFFPYSINSDVEISLKGNHQIQVIVTGAAYEMDLALSHCCVSVTSSHPLLLRYRQSFLQAPWLDFSCRGPSLSTFWIQPNAESQDFSIKWHVPFSKATPVSYH